jgi:hypothetical protein
VRPTEDGFTAYHLDECLGAVLAPNNSRGVNPDYYYLNDGGDFSYACAVDRSQRGQTWGEQKNPDLVWLNVPGLEGTLKLRLNQARGHAEIFVPREGQGVSAHFRPEDHLVLGASRLASWSDIFTVNGKTYSAAYLKHSIIYDYADSYDLHDVLALGGKQFLLVGKARSSKNPETYRAYFVDSNALRQQVAVRLERRQKVDAIGTQFGSFTLCPDTLEDEDIPKIASLLANAKVLLPSPTTIHTRQELIEALGLDFAPPRLLQGAARFRQPRHYS